MFASEPAAVVIPVLTERQAPRGVVLLSMMSRQGLLNMGQDALMGASE